MHYLLVSLSHKNTDLKLREKMAFDGERKTDLLKALKKRPAINEVMVLTTCNRMEIITSVNNPHDALACIFMTLNECTGIDKAELEGRADSFEDEGAVRHVFSVASALESVVVGETQITGQLKDDFKFAEEAGFAGQKLTRLVNYALKCAGAVRNATQVGKAPVSVASAAVANARQVFGSLGGMTAVVVGTGEMSQLAAKHLVAQEANVIIVSREARRAQALADELDGDVRTETFTKLEQLVNAHKLLFTATGAPHTIINPEMVKPREFDRHWFDVAVPRDISEEITLDGVFIHTVDDLKSVVKQNMDLREEEAGKAYKIVGQYTGEFFNWLQTLSVDPIIKAMRDRAREVSVSELQRHIKKGYMPAEHEEAAMKFLHNVFNSFLHEPTARLKEVMEKPEADQVIEATRYLFGIDQELLRLVPDHIAKGDS